MSQQSENIIQRILQLRDETTPAANTATRVGQLLLDMLNYLKSQDRPEYLRKDQDDATPHRLGVGTLLLGAGERKVEIGVDEDGNVRINGNVYATGGLSAYGRGAEGQGGGSIDQQAVEDIVNSIITPAMRANWNAAYAVVDGAADADNVINKWHEVVSLLSGLGEAANLADLLDTFAPKNTIVSAGQGISLYTGGQTVGSVTLADDFDIRVNAGGGLTFDATTGALKVNAGSGLSINASTGVLSLSLPTASASTLGGVKVGKGLAISSGVLSLPLTDSATVGYMVYTGSTWVKRAAVPVADIQEMWDAA